VLCKLELGKGADLQLGEGQVCNGGVCKPLWPGLSQELDQHAKLGAPVTLQQPAAKVCQAICAMCDSLVEVPPDNVRCMPTFLAAYAVDDSEQAAEQHD